MLALRSSLPQPIPPRLRSTGETTPIAQAFTADSAGSDMSLLGMMLLKSFAMLVGRGEAAPPAKRERRNRVIGSSGDPVIGKAAPADLKHGVGTVPCRLPEARYAYYRRCQQFRRNGEQCKAPAMKGEAICHRHAEQQDAERRRRLERRELLSRPGAGPESFRAIQRTIGMVAQALLDDRIDAKLAGRLIIEIQNAIRVKRALAAEARRRGVVPTGARTTGRSSDQPRQARWFSRPLRRHGEAEREAENVREIASERGFLRVALAAHHSENQRLAVRSAQKWPEPTANSQERIANVMIV
jgi:hypothetical protein